jgi:glycosyltransferase involved in cell wall biosynthesis
VRILLVDLGSAWRGGQSQALLLLQGLRARGHDAELVSVPGAALAERARAAGIRVHTAAATLGRLGAAGLIRRLLREHRFEILHANEAHALTAVWLAGAHRQARVVVSRRVVFPLKGSRLARARYRAARRILAISRFVAQRVEDSGLPAGVVRVVYDGVELPPALTPEARHRARQRWKTAPDEPLLGCVGYLLPGKGQESLLRALPAIRARIPNCRLLLAGDGPCRLQLERLAEQLGVHSAVMFAGHLEDVSEVYRALDLFVFPSLGEGLGSSLLAAMSCGLPVMAVADGGVSEVIEEGSGLLLAQAGPDEIARAAADLLLDRDRAARLGAAARRVIERRFTADHMVDATLNIYSELCEADGAVPGALAGAFPLQPA